MVGNTPRLIMATVGFEESLVMRGLLRLGLREDDKALLVYSSTGNEYDMRRVIEAVGYIKRVVSQAKVPVAEAPISAMDFIRDIKEIVARMKETADGISSIELVLAGGMRLLIFEALVAALVYRTYASYLGQAPELNIHLMREDGLYAATLKPSLLSPPQLSQRELDLLRIVESGVERARFVAEAASKLGVSENMVYRLIRGLEDKGVIAVTDGKVTLTGLGEVIKEVVRA